MSSQHRASRRSATGPTKSSAPPNDEDAMSQPVRSSRRAVSTAGPMANGSSAANVAPASGSNSPADTAKVKKERAAAAAAAARQARRETVTNGRQANGTGRVELDIDVDDDDDEGDEAETSTASARKRKRCGDDGGEVEDVADEGHEDADAEESGAPRGRLSGPVEQMRGSTAKRAADGFLPGAIVRVKLANFVTYDAVEFRPGPYLNMIIGPNGTGKSTVVCAIALGLGWKPGVLGRAKDVAAYVKQGHQSGSIEIELKGKEGQRNPVIRRVIFKKSNKSDWTLNGRNANLTEINDLVTDLDIQIGNLCSFLPQDKVADFAAMQPPDLLKETQKAAGDGKLTHWHNQLIKLGAELKELMGKLNSDEEEVANLQQRNEVLQRDVRRYEERRRIELSVQVLQMQMLFARYNVVKLEYDEAKKVRNQKKEELRRLQQKHEPLTSLLAELEEEERDVEKERKKLSRDVDRHVSDLRSREREYSQLEQKFEDEVEKRDTVEQREKERKSLITSLRKAIESLEERVADAPAETSTQGIDQRVKELKQQQRQLQNQLDDFENTLEEQHTQMKVHHDQKTETLKRLAALDNVKAARFKMLAQADRDCAEAVRWLRENSGLFQKKVYEPVMLEASITDPRHAAAVESCINWNHMRTFVCQTRADYDLFTAEVIDKKRLRVNAAEHEGGRSWDQQPRPMPIEQLRELGFNEYIIDLVDAPDPILSFLCHAANLHMIPVAFDDRAVDIEQVEARRVFRRYITGLTNHTVTFSSYGRRLPQTLSRALKPARTFSHSIDQQLKADLDARMKTIAARMSDGEKEIAKLRQNAEAVRTKLQAQKEVVEDAQRERRELQRPLQEWERAKATLQSKRTALAKEEAAPSAAAQSSQIASSIQKLVVKQAKLASEMQALVVEEVRMRGRRDEASLRSLKLQQSVEALKGIITEQSNIYTSAQEALDAAQDNFVACKAAAVKSHNEAQDSFDKADSEVMEIFRERGGGNQDSADLNELEEKLEAEQAKLHLAHGVSANVIDAFRKREADIKALEATIADRRRDKNKLDRKIGDVKGKWLPALEALVENVSEKFSQAFDRLGCAGEVRLSQNDDYDKWGIDILVKFRDNEQLQLLSGQRQSGGERSLSTILYLMSLTELSRSPFSLVDEINQGMDQRAERAVHDQMVEVTCKKDASQYFLITPKLLPDLRFHERMKVLVINNGEWLPETFNFNRYVARKRKRMDIAAAGSGPSRGTAAAH